MFCFFLIIIAAMYPLANFFVLVRISSASNLLSWRLCHHLWWHWWRDVFSCAWLRASDKRWGEGMVNNQLFIYLLIIYLPLMKWLLRCIFLRADWSTRWGAGIFIYIIIREECHSQLITIHHWKWDKVGGHFLMEGHKWGGWLHPLLTGCFV